MGHVCTHKHTPARTHAHTHTHVHTCIPCRVFGYIIQCTCHTLTHSHAHTQLQTRQCLAMRPRHRSFWQCNWQLPCTHGHTHAHTTANTAMSGNAPTTQVLLAVQLAPAMHTHTTANTAMHGNAPTTQELLAVLLAPAMHTYTLAHNCKHGDARMRPHRRSCWQCNWCTPSLRCSKMPAFPSACVTMMCWSRPTGVECVVSVFSSTRCTKRCVTLCVWRGWRGGACGGVGVGGCACGLDFVV